MTPEFVYLNPTSYNLLRSYVRGVCVLDTPLTSFGFADGVIEWVTGIYRVQGSLDSRFKAWSSNYYTFDYVWDRDSFHLWISGVPYAGAWGLFASLQVLLGYAGFYLGLSLFVSSMVSGRALIEGAPGTYWLPEPLT